ncbi:MAG: tryptophan synthase subunit alpha [Nanoarchaeota archaeon]|nr:tryptophan synthase subunit alpha [Nanoarchaeota archaeon]MBU1004740.1 tryptophan synthase subunit alpha [Nanoarchaeota archaeon]MBU1945687.1 tryptophan synthase subunit alpha [Nanoarchaeota archaeon]
MNRYNNTFKRLKKNKQKALIPFVVVGDPNYSTSLEIVKTIINAGADILELGFSFSEPIADGPTIQTAGIRALNSGSNTDKNLNFIKQIRKFNNKIPIGILIYSNLIYQRGIERFYKDARDSGIDSVLVADLPIEEADEYIKAARKHKVATVFIVSPLTSNERLKKITKKVKGFIYVVSRLGVTGAKSDLQKGTISLLNRIRPKTNLPLCVGFGISKPEHVKEVCKAKANGAIVGSAIVKIIEKNLKNKRLMLKKIGNYIKNLKQSTL